MRRLYYVKIIDMNMLAFRILPNCDLRTEIERLVKENDIDSGFVATCVGSLQSLTIRMADAKPEHKDVRKFDGNYEIVSLTGTISRQGSHLHISVSDSEGVVIGGHLKEGSIVATTAEIVIGYDEDVKFERKRDESTGFDELCIL